MTITKKASAVFRLNEVRDYVTKITCDLDDIVVMDHEAGQMLAYLETAYDCLSAAKLTLAEACTPKKDEAKEERWPDLVANLPSMSAKKALDKLEEEMAARCEDPQLLHADRSIYRFVRDDLRRHIKVSK